MITTRAPTPVVLSPAATGFVTVNKYRCDLGDRGLAVTIHLTSPNNTVPLSGTIPADRASFAYCGPGDPGSIVFISPVTATLKDTLAH